MKSLLVAALCVLAASSYSQDPAAPVKAKQPERRVIDLAICLDTSGSMDGLINSARQKIWAIVNDLALAKPTPRLRVALLTYGNAGHDAGAGWVRVDTGLTDDLDKVSQMLFALTTNGGTELVGRVMQAALARLDWSKRTDALRIMIVAGNESADQDKEVSFRLMCRRAIGRDIMVNSIYCTRAGENVAHEWKEIARLSDGHYAAIDQSRGTVTIDTPFDAEIASLSAAVNKTYVAFGKAGKRGQENQQAQDKNAENLNRDAAAQRGVTKAQVLYFCRWCLVDATRNNAVKLKDVKEEDLPENMRSMTLEQRQAYLDRKYKERVEIQEKIKELARKRQEYVDAEMAKLAKKDDKSFDAAVRKAIRKQAKSKGYDW